MKNKTKYEKAKKIVDTMVFNYETGDYEFLTDRCERLYGNLDSKPQIIGVLEAKADTNYIPNMTKEEMRIRLDEIAYILNKYGQYLYSKESTWEYIQREKEEQNG